VRDAIASRSRGGRSAIKRRTVALTVGLLATA
jgi:hypothetical protein